MNFIFVGIGLIAGVLAGLFGIGGGIVIVPMLLLATPMTILRATGTSLAALLLPVGAFGAWEYYKNGNLDVKAALVIAIGLTIGVFFGARIAQVTSPVLLRRGFALMLLVVAARMWVTTPG